MTNNIDSELARLLRKLSSTASQWGKALEPLIEMREQVCRSLQAIAEPVLEARRTLEETFAQIAQQLAAFQKQVRPFLADVACAVEHLPQRNQEALRVLAWNGWYVDPDLPPAELFELATLFELGEALTAHTQLCDYFDSRLAEIEAALCEHFPTRAKLLRSAFGAHRRTEFALAIPVLLAQADGVCQEITGIQLYSRRNGIPMLASELALRDVTPLLKSLLTPLVKPMPISASADERAGLADTLNRHAVLHGESVDYASRLNSCRAISLLVYVSWVLRVQ